jgi:hypothetical protein
MEMRKFLRKPRIKKRNLRRKILINIFDEKKVLHLPFRILKIIVKMTIISQTKSYFIEVHFYLSIKIMNAWPISPIKKRLRDKK